MQIFFGNKVRAGWTLLPDEKPKTLFTQRQVHGAQGRLVTEREESGGEGDYLMTSELNLPVGVCVADCTALLLSGRRNDLTLVSAVHAGWRGTAEGILQNLARDWAGVEDLKVWLSPSICAEHFEVGPEVLEKLGSESKKFATRGKGDRWHLDLKGFQIETLRQLFRSPVEILSSSLCTYCQPEFFSYRRAQAKLGPQQRHWAWIERQT